MSLRERFLRLLARGEPDVPDPDAIVDAGWVPYPVTAVVMSELEQAGIRAAAIDGRLPPGEGPVSETRIQVRAADLARARRVIDDVTTTYEA
jgi:hypothetical protein